MPYTWKATLENGFCTFPQHCHYCTALLLANLAEPHWISVECHEKLTHYVLCVIPNDYQSEFEVALLSDFYCQDSILLTNSCVMFLWQNWAHSKSQSCYSQLNNFQFLFEAVNKYYEVYTNF